MSSVKRWAVVIVFAGAFAWVEAAAVTYLRVHLGRVVPYQTNPLPIANSLGEIELAREAATLIILLTMGWLAGRDTRTRFAYTALAFGVWDILYYAFLWIHLGWPRTLTDWDVLFLLPLPWWGPVLAPMLIAALMFFAGTLVALFDRPVHRVWPTARAWMLCIPGVALALILFMQEALRAIPHGSEVIRARLPTSFAWPFFGLAMLLMSAPIVDLLTQLRKPTSFPQPHAGTT